MSSRWNDTDAPRGADYDERFVRMAASGQDVHGEATFVAGFQPRSVLDAGCGTGRVAIELRRRGVEKGPRSVEKGPRSVQKGQGVEAVGIDADAAMLAAAKAGDPGAEWHLGDISTMRLEDDAGARRTFDVVVAAGNVMIFLAPGTEAAAIANLAAHLTPGGALICGFQLKPDRYSLAAYEADCVAAGLVEVERWSTWDRRPFEPGGDYVVAVHRSPR